jgi:uncharacterized protein YkwD
MLGFKPKPPPVDINKLIPTTPSMAERIKMAAEAEKRLPAAANPAAGKTGKQFANPAGSSGGMVNRTMHTQPAAFTGNHAAPGNMTVGDDHSLQTQQLKRLIDETNAERHKVNLKPLPLPPQKP